MHGRHDGHHPAAPRYADAASRMPLRAALPAPRVAVRAPRLARPHEHALPGALRRDAVRAWPATAHSGRAAHLGDGGGAHSGLRGPAGTAVGLAGVPGGAGACNLDRRRDYHGGGGRTRLYEPGPVHLGGGWGARGPPSTRRTRAMTQPIVGAHPGTRRYLHLRGAVESSVVPPGRHERDGRLTPYFLTPYLLRTHSGRTMRYRPRAG